MYVEAYETSSSYKSQLYNAFVISDVHVTAVCVLFLIFLMNIFIVSIPLCVRKKEKYVNSKCI